MQAILISLCLCVCVTYCCMLLAIITEWWRGKSSHFDRCCVVDFLLYFTVTVNYTIDIKNIENVFYSCHVSNVFNVFLFCQRFLFLKTFIENSMKELRKALLKPQYQINRPRFYYQSGWMQSSSVLITLGGAYSDTAALTSCSRRSQYVKLWIATNWIKFSLSLVTAILHL